MKWFKRVGFIVLIIPLFYLIHTWGLFGVDEQVKAYLHQLDDALKKEGYAASYILFSAKRPKWQNDFLVAFGGAASKSKHLSGQAIDIIILDINKDGRYDAKDVDIVYQILHEKVIKNRGGIGTYKNESGFFNRQMVHFDSREKKARWHR